MDNLKTLFINKEVHVWEYNDLMVGISCTNTRKCNALNRELGMYYPTPYFLPGEEPFFKIEKSKLEKAAKILGISTPKLS